MIFNDLACLRSTAPAPLDQPPQALGELQAGHPAARDFNTSAGARVTGILCREFTGDKSAETAQPNLTAIRQSCLDQGKEFLQDFPDPGPIETAALGHPLDKGRARDVGRGDKLALAVKRVQLGLEFILCQLGRGHQKFTYFYPADLVL